jgi:pSer/pThr/pTyr-binding forkhead associated (FHA) protein
MEQPSSDPSATPAFLVFRDGNDRQHVRAIDAASSPVTIGREPGADISLAWDEKVSRRHARVELVGEDLAADWTVIDDGSSRNGSFLNGVRVRGRARLADGDTLSFGSTAVVFHAPAPRAGEAARTGEPSTADAEARATGAREHDTLFMSVAISRASLSDSEHRVLTALARPCRGRDAAGPPAGDEQIARELFLAADTVRAHLQAMFRKFGVAALEPEEQRARLVERAFQLGILGDRDVR